PPVARTVSKTPSPTVIPWSTAGTRASAWSTTAPRPKPAPAIHTFIAYPSISHPHWSKQPDPDPPTSAGAALPARPPPYTQHHGFGKGSVQHRPQAGPSAPIVLIVPTGQGCGRCGRSARARLWTGQG